MNSKCIELKNISYSYENKKIFHSLFLKFKAGVTTAIMAPSGTGKTTLLHIICGLISPDTGEILYPVSNPRFSMVFQENRLVESISVYSNIKLVNKTLSKDDIADILKSMELKNVCHKKTKNLSGGEKRRVAIARALSAAYDILLLDEPFTGLDDDTKFGVMQYIKDKTKGKTVILVTHNKEDAVFFNCTDIIAYEKLQGNFS